MRNILILIPFLLLTGCAFDPAMFKSDPEIKVVTVEKPLLYCPAPPSIPYPRLVIENLVAGDELDPGRVVQYYKATVKQMEGEIKARDVVIKAYEAISTKDPNLSPADVDKMFKEMTNETTTPNN